MQIFNICSVVVMVNQRCRYTLSCVITDIQIYIRTSTGMHLYIDGLAQDCSNSSALAMGALSHRYLLLLERNTLLHGLLVCSLTLISCRYVENHWLSWHLHPEKLFILLCVLGWGLLSQFPPFRYFLKFSASPKYMWAIVHHVHIWQVLPQLSCGDTCQIWMWCK